MDQMEGWWKGDDHVFFSQTFTNGHLSTTAIFFWQTVRNIDSCLNLSMTTTSLQWPLSSVSKEVIMERFSFIGQLVSATYWSIYQSSVGQCINQVQITLEECTIWQSIPLIRHKIWNLKGVILVLSKCLSVIYRIIGYCDVTMSFWQNLMLLSINMTLTDRQLADKIVRYLLLSKCVLPSLIVKRCVRFRWLIVPKIVFQSEPYFDLVKVKIASYPLTVMLKLHTLNIFLSFILNLLKTGLCEKKVQVDKIHFGKDSAGKVSCIEII